MTTPVVYHWVGLWGSWVFTEAQCLHGLSATECNSLPLW